MADKRAIKILCDHYWSPGGWLSEAARRSTPDDVAYATQAGVMFSPESTTHDELVSRLVALIASQPLAPVVSGFVASLSTRRLELRSALGSYAVFRHLPLHPIEPGARVCQVCASYDASADDLNVLSFERFKWGGVRHANVRYAVFDLERFASDTIPTPTDADRSILRGILEAVRTSPRDTTAAALQRRLAPVLRSNKAERDMLVAILGHTGILRTPGHVSGRQAFVRARDREEPSRRFVDMAYPACWWTGADGIDDAAVEDYFGGVL